MDPWAKTLRTPRASSGQKTETSPSAASKMAEKLKFIGTNESSVYRTVGELLGKTRGWQRLTSSTSPAARLVLSNLNQHVDFKRLGPVACGRPKTLVNFFRGMKGITNKHSLVETLRSHHEHNNGLDPELIAPVTFILTSGEDNQSRDDWLISHAARFGRGDEPVWIAKTSFGAKGEDVKISNNPADILAHIDRETKGKLWVVQEYIKEPLLLSHDRKFDIRIWVLVDEQFNAYVYREGVLRTCSVPYSCDNFNDQYVHLSNHCIQETNKEHFAKYEKGNEMFFAEFEKYLHSTFAISFRDTIWREMCFAVSQTLSAIREKTRNQDSQNYLSFQLLGYDFVVEKSPMRGLKTWLLEVNAAPACAADLNPAVSEAIIKVAIDPYVMQDENNKPYEPRIGELYPETLFERVL